MIINLSSSVEEVKTFLTILGISEEIAYNFQGFDGHDMLDATDEKIKNICGDEKSSQLITTILNMIRETGTPINEYLFDVITFRLFYLIIIS